MKVKPLYFLFLVGVMAFGQSESKEDKSEEYKDYREDQFYLAITYNILNEKPSAITQSGFSPGFHFGFIRDMPINKRRNFALGLGLGFSTNSYNQNLAILENENQVDFNVISGNEINVSQNRFSNYLIEMPLQIRWRTSTATEYNFWRIYIGFKMGYVFYNATKYKSDVGDQKLSNIDEFNRFQYGLTLSAGINTWNFYAHYGLNPIFSEKAQLDGGSIDFTALKVGLIFYIL